MPAIYGKPTRHMGRKTAANTCPPLLCPAKKTGYVFSASHHIHKGNRFENRKAILRTSCFDGMWHEKNWKARPFPAAPESRQPYKCPVQNRIISEEKDGARQTGILCSCQSYQPANKEACRCTGRLLCCTIRYFLFFRGQVGIFILRLPDHVVKR